MRDAVAHHDADGFACLDVRIVQCARHLLDELRDLVARIPLPGELDERPITVGLQPGGQADGEIRGVRHAG